ncbi:PAS domain S-box protein [Rhodanobacter sp. 7MK24]|uniref:PAS domain S-box protein n=1 Tax=Rhodanobacter sp. 7MK24 TaxID=2775922 RepID=UPI0017843DC6|nr:PAS domain S-box protein [Rhodanobacter sp. 7MK24]MBD8882325.1 PAS domain S-box protein [Rhodanobacter sp. 7MK24]
MTWLHRILGNRPEADAWFGDLGRCMIQAMPWPACVCDRQGQLLAWNEDAKRLLELVRPDDSTIEARFRDLLRNGQRAGAVGTSLIDVLQSGGPACDAVLEIESDPSVRLLLHARLTPLVGKDGSVKACLCSFQDPPPFSDLTATFGWKGTAEREHRQDDLFRQMLQALPVAVYTTDVNGTIMFFNEAAVALAGRRPSVKDKWCVSWKLLHPDGTPLPHDECPMAATLRDGCARYASQIVTVRPDGSRVVCEAYPTPLLDKSGVLVGALNVLIDISGRIDAEQALRSLNETLEQRVLYRTNRAEAALARLHRREREFALLVESVLDYAIIMLDPEGNITQWNRGAERIYGYRSEEIVGRHFSTFHTPEDRANGMPEKVLATASCEGRHEGEGWRLRKDGSLFWVSAIVDPIVDKGQLVGFAKITRDITERMKSQAAIVENERRARAVIDTAPDGFVQLDPAGRVVEWNPAAVTMFGWSREEAIGKELIQLIVPDDERDRFVERVSLSSANMFQHDAVPLKLRAKGGDLVTVELNFGTRSSWGNDPLNLFISDIGERISIEAQLRQMQKMESVGMLAGGIAHDFNNLLQGIIGAVEIIDLRIKDNDTRDVSRFIDGALNSAQRAAALTQRLLSFSRKQPLDPQSVDANQLVLSMSDMLQHTMGEAVAIDLELADDLWSCRCDANQLESALLNLSINARDAMPEGGRLTLRSANLDIDESAAAHRPDLHCGQFVLLTITDTGMGIPKEIVDQVFDPFFTTKEVGRGTGLGLSMVYGFAQQSGGFCEIRSEVDKGTIVSIGLPRNLAPPPETPRVAQLHPIRGAGELVLVVEDEPVVRGIVVQVLHQLGYSTLEAANGDEALGLLLTQESVDLLISDLGLPGMTGCTLVEAAHVMRPKLKILLMSGYAPDKTQGGKQATQKWPLITKPFSTAKLARCIREVMSKEEDSQPDPVQKDGA